MLFNALTSWHPEHFRSCLQAFPASWVIGGKCLAWKQTALCLTPRKCSVKLNSFSPQFSSMWQAILKPGSKDACREGATASRHNLNTPAIILWWSTTCNFPWWLALQSGLSNWGENELFFFFFFFYSISVTDVGPSINIHWMSEKMFAGYYISNNTTIDNRMATLWSSYSALDPVVNISPGLYYFISATTLWSRYCCPSLQMRKLRFE